MSANSHVFNRTISEAQRLHCRQITWALFETKLWVTFTSAVKDSSLHQIQQWMKKLQFSFQMGHLTLKCNTPWNCTLDDQEQPYGRNDSSWTITAIRMLTLLNPGLQQHWKQLKIHYTIKSCLLMWWFYKTESRVTKKLNGIEQIDTFFLLNAGDISHPWYKKVSLDPSSTCFFELQPPSPLTPKAPPSFLTLCCLIRCLCHWLYTLERVANGDQKHAWTINSIVLLCI